MFLIVKRKGHKEKFDEKKAYASCYYAARNCHYSEQKSEKIASAALSKLKSWLKGKNEIDSAELFQFIAKQLKQIDKDAGFMYETHRDIN